MTKISGLPADVSPTTTDSIATVDTETSTTKRVLLSAIATLFNTSPTISAPVITSPPTNISRVVGEMSPYAGFTAPTDWLVCDGTAVSRATYSALFAAIVPSKGTFTVTLATPGVFTLTAHNLQTGDQVYLTTTGTLPTGLAQNTLYYAVRIDANTFNLATSRANAYAATKIATSVSQSGVHTLRYCPYGLGDGSTTFNVPDARGRALAGFDSIGGSVASRLTLAQTQGIYGNQGANGGEQGHTLVTAELASHNHQEAVASAGGASTGITGTASLNTGSTGVGQVTGNQGSDTAHNNIQPTLLVNYIIKT